MSMKGGVKHMTKELERFTLRLSKHTKEQLEKQSKTMCISLNALVSQILWDWVKQQEKLPAR